MVIEKMLDEKVEQKLKDYQAVSNSFKKFFNVEELGRQLDTKVDKEVVRILDD